MTRRLALLFLVFVSLVGCQLFQVPVKAEDKDFVTDAKEAVEQLKGDYVLTKGVAALLEHKADEFLYIEDGLRLGRVKWKQFRGELDACWTTPVETMKNAPSAAVNVMDAAKSLNRTKALHELVTVQTAGQNAFDRVKACPQSMADQIGGFPRRAKEEAKAWGYSKLTLLNEVRVLVKDEVPSRLETLGKTAVDSPTRVGKQLSSAQAYRKTLEQIGDAVALKSNQRQIDQLKRLQRESKKLASTVQSDAGRISGAVTETAGRITTGFQRFGKRRP